MTRPPPLHQGTDERRDSSADSKKQRAFHTAEAEARRGTRRVQTTLLPPFVPYFIPPWVPKCIPSQRLPPPLSPAQQMAPELGLDSFRSLSTKLLFHDRHSRHSLTNAGPGHPSRPPSRQPDRQPARPPAHGGCRRSGSGRANMDRGLSGGKAGAVRRFLKLEHCMRVAHESPFDLGWFWVGWPGSINNGDLEPKGEFRFEVKQAALASLIQPVIPLGLFALAPVM